MSRWNQDAIDDIEQPMFEIVSAVETIQRAREEVKAAVIAAATRWGMNRQEITEAVKWPICGAMDDVDPDFRAIVDDIITAIPISCE